jgi:hypothetical protein
MTWPNERVQVASVSPTLSWWRYLHSAVGRHRIEVWQHHAVDVLTLIVAILSFVAVSAIGWITYNIMLRDYWDRRITAVLETVSEMPDEYSQQYIENGYMHPTPAVGTREKVRRQDPRRTLHAQVSVFKDNLRSRPDIYTLATANPEPWGMPILDRAIRGTNGPTHQRRTAPRGFSPRSTSVAGGWPGTGLARTSLRKDEGGG